MYALQVEHIRRTFYDVVAVKDISLIAPAGRVVGLVGPNGSGKTTLLLMLAGLLSPDSGSIEIGGYNMANQPNECRRLIGWMPDELGYWESLTPLEILEFFATTYGLDKAQTIKRSQEVLELVSLSEFGNRPARVLSRGQKQRLNLARALLHEPQVLLLDEPANGLDPRSRIHLRQLVRDYAQTGRSVIVSSHVLTELEGMIDEAVFINRGCDVPRPQTDDEMKQWLVCVLNPEALRQWAESSGLDVVFDPVKPNNARISLPDETAAAQALESLVRSGVRISSFQPHIISLEDSFMALTEEAN